MTTLIIGGGWSGLTAAVKLSQQGHPVHIVESAKHFGGRARSVEWQDKSIDNGQHIIIGAYKQMLAMMQLVGVDPETVFNRLTINLSIYDTEFSPLHLSAEGKLPWPWSLAWNVLRSAGFSGLKHLIVLQHSIPKLLKKDDITVLEWLEQGKQPKRLIKQLWEPLCLATLNTSTDQASAHVMAHVLRDSLGQDQNSADLLIPRCALGELFPESALKFIAQHGGEVSKQTRIAEIVTEDGEVQGAITTKGRFIDANNIIIATAPDQASQLLASHVRFPRPRQNPITTVYLQYPEHCRLPKPMLGMTGTTSHWLFDRSPQHPGLISVIISADGEHEQLSKQELIELISEEVHLQVPELPKEALDAYVVREKRATFMCTVTNHKQRLQCQTAIQGLFLAGDYIANNYPATIEGAVMNGQRCAEYILARK
jgi:squalene-associated FAD-dependent desaturase